MATYYKYAERTADSQINWAEIGKNMTDMLQQEVAIREEKKAALDEVTRKAAEQISNAPQGEHESGRAEAIRLADQASKYLLMQDRLMKQGLLDPKDYMISRQNLSDGVKQAYTSIKAFQANYSRLLENAQKDKSSAISIARLEKIQGYGNFNQSGFFIDAPTGKLNVGLKEEQIVDGKKVIGLKKGSTVGMQYIDGAIYGEIDKFKYMEPLKQMADGVGEFVTATITPGTLSSIGYVTTVSDVRKRIDAMNIGQDDKRILYDFYASSYDTINSILENQNHKASLLVDAMASKGYFWTDDPDVAAKDPKAVLEVIDPGTGRGVMKFSKEQDQAATDFMMQQFLGMIDVKETKASTGQIQAQYAPESVTKGRADAQAQEVAAGYWNDILSAKNIQEAQAAADILIGTPRAIEMELTKIDFTSNPGSVVLNYDNPAMNRTIKMFDDSGNPVNRRDWAALGVELHGVVDREKAIKAGGGAKEYGGLKKEDYMNVGTERQGSNIPKRVQVVIPSSAIGMSSTDAAAAIKEAVPANFTVEDLTPGLFSGNQVKITAPNKKTFTINTRLTGDSAEKVKQEIEAFIKLNNVAPETPPAEAGGTTAASGAAATATGVGSKY
jgi:hypothetical protein